jgi:hypothetical protein
MTLRNYAREYKNYHGLPKQIKERSSRNQARAIMVKLHGKEKCYNMHVDHIDHNPLNNNISNLRLLKPSENLKDNKHKH